MYDQVKRIIFKRYPQIYLFMQRLVHSYSWETRAKKRLDAATYNLIETQFGDTFSSDVTKEQEKTVIFFSLGSITGCVLELPILAAFQKAGYRPYIFASRNYHLISTYRLLGYDRFDTVDEYHQKLSEGGEQFLQSKSSLGIALLNVCYGYVQIGKYALSTLLRRNRKGSLNFKKVEDRTLFRKALYDSAIACEASKRIFQKYRPSAIVMTDRGYTPFGEMFDEALGNGVPVFTFNASHKTGEINLKRLNLENENLHFLALSDATWHRLLAMDWPDSKWADLERFFINNYNSGDWFSEVGTQFGIENHEVGALTKQLSLDPNKKTAIIFAHMFFDATFFYGVDLFQDYEEWLCETLIEAAKNEKVNWIVKVHPANVVKAQRDGATGEHLEITAIKRTLGAIPSHIKILPANTTVGTLPLFSLMDYCVTVRGTIGIEAACRGIRVLTAGTGRYDGYGFTDDFSSQKDYWKAISSIETRIPLGHKETELARRYAYGVFKVRSFPYTSVGFSFMRDAKAQMKTWVNVNNRDELMQSDDVLALSEWIASGEEDCCHWENDERI